ncbi:MAG TPA: hypothetical protein DCM87_19705 [Planctomycetes bacterium]|nr:hypothetical protein [Planctomycetota bacterium]
MTRRTRARMTEETKRLTPAQRLERLDELQARVFAAMSPDGRARFERRNRRKRRRRRDGGDI